MEVNHSQPFIGRLCMMFCLQAIFTLSVAAQDKSPKLRVGDTIHVNVVEETITGDYEISEKGSFQMPYLDEPVPASGKTTTELEQALLKMLKPDYLLNPQVIVTLIDKKKYSCTVIGRVTSPRLIQYDPDGGLTLLGALGQAGDVTPAGDRTRIEITRSGRTISAPMPQSKNMRIVKGDTINVPSLPPLGTYSLSGFVRKRGEFTIPRGSTHTLMWAIDHAGGVEDTGSLKRVELRRAGRTLEFNSVDELESEFIRPGDLIKVARKRF